MLFAARYIYITLFTYASTSLKHIDPASGPPVTSTGNFPRFDMSDKPLDRAAALLLKVWHAYREETYDSEIVALHWQSPRVLAVQTDGLPVLRRRPGSLLVAFPEHICTGPNDKTILLDFFACCISSYHMVGLVEWMLKGGSSFHPYCSCYSR